MITKTIESIIKLDKIWIPYCKSAVKSPTAKLSPPLWIIILEAKKHTKIVAVYIENCIIGEFHATIFSALTKFSHTSSEAFANFCFSKSSRTYVFTTLIPLIFSWTDEFKASYLVNTLLNFPIANFTMIYKPTPKNGNKAMYISANFALIINVIILENIIIKGTLIAILIPIL